MTARLIVFPSPTAVVLLAAVAHVCKMDSQLRRRAAPITVTKDEYYVTDNSEDEKHARYRGSKSLSLWHMICLAAFVLGFVCIAIFPHQSLPTPKLQTHANEQDFTAEKARSYLEQITNIGFRTVGSYRNDILTVDYLLKEIYAIISNSHVHYHFDVGVQTASGSYSLYFLHKDFTVVYDNISNIVVHMYPKSTKDLSINVLLNAHFDTQPKTVGASDDAVSCAIMLETMRAISRSPPRTIRQGIVFLFNGAEEGLLDGSHAFVTRHELAKTIKAFVNLEAAGSGGREIVFQTGPGHPWLIYTYASAAKYPYASILAQEIFQSGIIPSDTDFRIFRDFGKLAGIDVAYASNGYVYHTKHDIASVIPDGSIQRGGENILAVVKALSKSPYLAHEDEFTTGEVVFFDFLGLTMILYPKKIAVIVDFVLIVIVIGYVILQLLGKDLRGSKEEISETHMPSLGSVIAVMFTVVISWVSAVVFTCVEAYILSKLQKSLSWYSKPWFSLLLYGLPALAVIMIIHYAARHVIKLIQEKQHLTSYNGFILERSCILVHFLIIALTMAYMLWKEILSTYLVAGYLIFPLIFHAFVGEWLHISEESELFVFKLMTTHIGAVAVPIVLFVYHLFAVFDVFVPIMGRQGSEIPPDIVFAVICTLSVIVLSLYIISVVYLVRQFHTIVLSVSLASVVVFMLAATGIIFPYSSNYPVAPKRIFMQHVVRTFHNLDGKVIKNDSGVWLAPLDYLGLKPVMHLPALEGVVEVQCDGPYCGFPYFYPIRKLLQRTWYLKGPQPFPARKPFAQFKIKKQERVKENIFRYYCQVHGPDHMTLLVTPNNSSKLVAWSLTDGQPAGQIDFDGRITYYTYYAHGFYANAWKFWLDFQLSAQHDVNDGIADIALAAHFVHGPLAMTKFMQNLIETFPEWVTDLAWVSSYDVWKI